MAVRGIDDARKLHSYMTLSLQAVPDEAVFGQVLDRFYGGETDPATESRLQSYSYRHSACRSKIIRGIRQECPTSPKGSFREDIECLCPWGPRAQG